MSYLDENGLSALVQQIKDNFVSDSDLSTTLQSYLTKTGVSNVNPVNSLNNFVTGLGIFSSQEVADCPESSINNNWLVISAGDSANVIVQVAFPIYTGSQTIYPYIRYKRSGQSPEWWNWVRLGVGTFVTLLVMKAAMLYK